MLLRRNLFACAVGLMLAAPLSAAPLSADAKNASGPTLLIQGQSLNEMVARIKAIVKAYVPERAFQEFEEHVLKEIDPKQLAGIDAKRPFGLYATIDAGVLNGDFSKSQAVALVPVSSEKEFFALIEKIGVKATEQKDPGLYAIDVPNAPVPVFLRFSKQYAYVSIGSSAAVDPKQMLDPKDVIVDTEKDALVMRLFIERVPKEVKTAILEALDGATAVIKDLPLPEGGREAFEAYVKWGLRLYRNGLEGGRDVTYRIDLDVKSGLVADITLTPKPNTKLAESIAAIKPTTNRFVGLIGPDAAAHGVFSLPLYVPELQTVFGKLIEMGSKEAVSNLEVGNAPKEAIAVVSELFAAMGRTVKSGEMDVAASLRGPNKDGHFAAIGAVSLKDTADLEKVVKAAAKLIPPQQSGLLKLDAHKVGGKSVHEIAVGEMLPKEAQAVFGKASVYLCFAGDALCVSFGTSPDLISDAINSKPAPSLVLNAEIAGKRMAELVKKAIGKKEVDANEIEVGMWISMLTRQEKITILSFDVQGGQQIKLRVNYGVAPLMAFSWLFAARSAAEFRNVAPQAVPVKP